MCTKPFLQTSKSLANSASFFMSSILNACLHVSISVEGFMFGGIFFDIVQIGGMHCKELIFTQTVG